MTELQGLYDLEADFKKKIPRVPRAPPVISARMLRIAAHVQAEKENWLKREKLRLAVVKNFAVVKESQGRRQQYALYRLWRYLDVPKELILDFVKENVPNSPYANPKALDDLYADIFAELCAKADKCVLRRFMPKQEKHTCKLPGCTKPVHWTSSGKRTLFCSREHSGQYVKLNPGIYISQKTLRRMKKLWDSVLRRIESGEVQYQAQLLRKFKGSYASRICSRMEKEGLITRERANFEGRWTLRLRVAKHGTARELVK